MVKQRFYTLTEVGEILNISLAQARAIVRSGELPAIQIGGRGQWRVEDVKLEEYIAQAYQKAEQAIEQNQLT
ncbi:helix-turn-helix domain-containing protein [Rothia sp. P13129]|uniref:helix-turn-helix domain-containing protein n=1 Tax=unclassified Rothia (in: high G+C Gram-positive bacteria) TaxID=2689056 RepID=UPI003AC96B99